MRFPTRAGHRPAATLLAALLCSGVASLANAQGITRTDWQMYIADDVVYDESGVLSSYNGAPESYRFASIPPQFPAAGARQWVPAPDPQIINYLSINGDEVSRIKDNPLFCRTAFDYAYFQTVVSVPPGTAVNDFRIDFDGMDDGSRITIFNALYPEGTPDFPNGVNNFVRYNEQASMDLAQFLTTGDNRVVITQVDDCPSGNKFRSARVTLNGAIVAAESSGPVQATSEPAPLLLASHGDVHISTPDGTRYDFQGVGDYLLASNSDGSFQIQARQAAQPGNPAVSINIATAMLVNGDVIEFYGPERRFYVNGQELDISGWYEAGFPGAFFSLPGLSDIYVQGYAAYPSVTVVRYGEQHPEAGSHPLAGFRADHNARADYMDLGATGQGESQLTRGLLGILDHDTSNDILMRSGAVVAQPATQEQINQAASSWELMAAESLFGFSAPPTERSYVAPLELTALSPQSRTVAAVACAAAGVREVNLLRDCVYDVTATGDIEFAQGAARVQGAVDASPEAVVSAAATGISPEQELGPEALRAATVVMETVAGIPALATPPSRALPNGGVVPRVVIAAPPRAEPVVQQPMPAADGAATPAPEAAVSGVEITTADRQTYTLEQSGDFVLLRSGDGSVEVQVRHGIEANNPGGGLVPTAYAARVDGNQFEIYYDDRVLFVNGEQVDISGIYAGGRGIYTELPGGAEILIQQSSFNMMVELMRFAGSADEAYTERQQSIRTHDQFRGIPHRWVSTFFRSGVAPVVDGLIGSADGDASNDLRTREGEIISPQSRADIARLGDSWRVRPGESLFNMRPAVPTAAPVAEAHVAAAPVAEVVTVATEPMPLDDFVRGARTTAGGHYLIYQDDGNLCLYREVDNGFVWCINNDPSVRYADTVRVAMTPQGQLAGFDAAGETLYALPTTPPNEPTTFTIGVDGVLRIVNAAGNVLWASNQN